MPKRPPLVVYLDTQDYINIQLHRNEDTVSSVVRFLQTKIAEGSVIVAYSPMIVLEYLTRPEIGFSENRIERGIILNEFCGLNTFSMEFGNKSGLLRSDGNWVGDKLSRGISIKSILRQGVEKARKEISGISGLNRKARRKVSSDGYLNSYFKSISSTFGRRREDFGTMPVSQAFLDGRFIERYLQGEIGEAIVNTAFCKWMTNPEEFCKVYYEYYDSPNAMNHFFGSTIEKIAAAAKNAENLCGSILSSERTRLALRQNLKDAGIEKREAIKLTPAARHDFNVDASRAGMESSFGKGRAEHFLTYMLAIVRGKTTWFSSDFGDLFHFMYAYECDLFRCDKKMANIMADCQPFAEKLVASFFDLPNRIEELLAVRNLSKQE